MIKWKDERYVSKAKIHFVHLTVEDHNGTGHWRAYTTGAYLTHQLIATTMAGAKVEAVEWVRRQLLAAAELIIETEKWETIHAPPTDPTPAPAATGRH